MTEQEAIKELTEYIDCIDLPFGNGIREEAIEYAVTALEEIKQYRAIGTVEECREATEKQRAKKPVTYQQTNRADCPNCGNTVRGIKEPFGSWCSKCGKKLDWSE